jgi:release factor glutamine methyltransferase
LEHLLGFVDFCGRRYQVSPGVFVPRQRSALLVETAVEHGGSVILDLCCGCGALGLAVRDRLDPAVELVASDVSPAAVADARANGVTEAFAGDLFDAVPLSLRGRVDLLLLNAPYVPSAAVAGMPPEARDHEPRVALDGGPDGTDVQRRVLEAALGWLSSTGALLTETSNAQAPALSRLAGELGWTSSVVTDAERGATVLVALGSVG